MGRNKLIAAYRGRPVIRHVMQAVHDAGLGPPVLVVRGPGDPVMEALADIPFLPVVAEQAGQGMGHSLAAGIAAVPRQWDAAILCLGDMPLVGPDLLRTLADHARADALAVPCRGGRPGHPVLWGRDYFPELLALTGDAGGKSLIARHADRVQWIDWPDDDIYFDVDREEDLSGPHG